jgi:hypothetical protein
MEGISSRQGGHQVAQKLSSTTLPLSDDSLSGSFFSDTTVRSGTGFFSCTPTVGKEASSCFFEHPAALKMVHASRQYAAKRFMGSSGYQVNFDELTISGYNVFGKL